MPLSSIVVIVIRLFALNWLLTSVPLLLAAIASPLRHDHHVANVLVLYVPSVLLLILAALLWFLASAIARLVSRGVESTVSVGALSRADLYSFAFVFLGLFFILSSFADVINWVHYFVMASRAGPLHDVRVPEQNLYQLTRPCLTLGLGLVTLLGAPSWTRKLVASDQRKQRI